MLTCGESRSLRRAALLMTWTAVAAGHPADHETDLPAQSLSGTAVSVLRAAWNLHRLRRLQADHRLELRTQRAIGQILGQGHGRVRFHAGAGQLAYHRNELDTAPRHTSEGIRLCRQFAYTPESQRGGPARAAGVAEDPALDLAPVVLEGVV